MRFSIDKLGPFRLRLKGLESCPWNNLSLMDIAIVALEFVLAGETVVAAVFASKCGAWEFGWIGAMLPHIVTLEIREFLRLGLASFFETVIVSGFAEMRFLMLGKVNSRNSSNSS